MFARERGLSLLIAGRRLVANLHRPSEKFKELLSETLLSLGG